MRWGIFSDIHANYEALEAVFAALNQERIEEYLCLGDIVGYGADISKCIIGIERLNPRIIAGNHDWASVGLLGLTNFRPVAKEALIWTRENLNSAERQYLKNLKLTYQGDNFTAVHGNLFHPEKFSYVLDNPAARDAFSLLRANLCFIGHSHKPVTFLKTAQDVTHTLEAGIRIETQKSYIINVGSVGQPRDGDPRAAYAVYDSETHLVQIKRVPYDIPKAQDKIIKAGLPEGLAERLGRGR